MGRCLEAHLTFPLTQMQKERAIAASSGRGICCHLRTDRQSVVMLEQIVRLPLKNVYSLSLEASKGQALKYTPSERFGQSEKGCIAVTLEW